LLKLLIRVEPTSLLWQNSDRPKLVLTKFENLELHVRLVWVVHTKGVVLQRKDKPTAFSRQGASFPSQIEKRDRNAIFIDKKGRRPCLQSWPNGERDRKAIKLQGAHPVFFAIDVQLLSDRQV
jgi:hypothetical protein